MTRFAIIAVVIVLIVGGFVWAIAKPKITPMPQTAGHLDGTPSQGTPTSAATSPSLAGRTDFGEISLSVGGRADLLIVDNEGEHTGFDPTSGTTTQQIPHSLYETDTLGSDEAINAPAETAHSIHIDRPQDETYFVTLTGLKDGQYNLIIRTFAGDGSAQPAIQYTGQIAPGSQIKFRLNYASTNDAVSSLMRLSP
jgi:hypothetical protein